MRQNLKLPSDWDGNLWHYRNLGRTHAMHHHAELEFNLVTQGRGLYLLANRKYEIRRGDLLWLFPAQEHLLIEQTLDFEMWIGVFKPAAIGRITTPHYGSVLRESNPAGDFRRRLQERELARLELLLQEIAGGSEPVNLLNAGLAYVLLNAWRYFDRAAEVPFHDVHPAVERAARLIRNDSSLGLDELARRSGLSAQRLSRLFKQQTGIALVDFRNRQRIEKFLLHYGTGNRVTTLDAALEAGFGSYPQFHRVFKRVMGYPPRKHRLRLVVPASPSATP
ncbi:MAG TPA: helix-turn-helix domain-containing protein [Verrucomicrobiae bacterium]|nr:helix-turn-helix domain-containing protein [Verrucomicrobiae bacterium]